MTATIKTERLHIHPFCPEYISDRYIGWLNDKSLMRFSENRHRTHTRESCLEYLRSFNGSPHRFWAIFAGDDHVGNITARVDAPNSVADVGILIGVCGEGYGLEAWAAVCNHLLASGVRKITAGTMATNVPMVRIMEKSGMIFEGGRRRQFLVDGEEVDLVGACLHGKHHAPIYELDRSLTSREKVVTAEFLDVTEIKGQRISKEQLVRICHRYHWAASQCHGRDVLEVACGAGQGLATLKRAAGSLVAGDYSPEVLDHARNTAGDVPLYTFKAEAIPFEPNSFDLILLFEALYYVEAQAFFTEARRLLRKGGTVLIATANKDLYDFAPSPFTTRYLGTKELSTELREAGFDVELFGFLDTAEVGFRQRLLRPVKALASRLGLIPKTLRSRERLKKFFFGSMIEMPATVEGIAFDYEPPRAVGGDASDRRHKVLYCRAVLSRPSRSEDESPVL